MKTEPKIILRETKQIIPDKNLFGQSNFASNAVNVVIQLAKQPVQASRLSISNLDRYFQTTSMEPVPSDVNAISISNLATTSDIDGEDVKHDAFSNSNLEAERPTIPANDTLEMGNINNADRKKTNAVLEGQND